MADFHELKKYQNMKTYKYKVTYNHQYMSMAFVRIQDDAFIYVNDNEDYVRMYAQGYCDARGEKFYIE